MNTAREQIILRLQSFKALNTQSRADFRKAELPLKCISNNRLQNIK